MRIEGCQGTVLWFNLFSVTNERLPLHVQRIVVVWVAFIILKEVEIHT